MTKFFLSTAGLFLGICAMITLIAGWSNAMESLDGFYIFGYGAAVGCAIAYSINRLVEILEVVTKE